MLRYSITLLGYFFFVRGYENLTLFLCGIDKISDLVNSNPKLILSFQLKRKLQMLTLGIGGVGLVSAYVSYTPEVAARYSDFFVHLLT